MSEGAAQGGEGAHLQPEPRDLSLLKEPCLVVFKVQLHIHTGARVRVWHAGKVVPELPHEDRGPLRDAPLTVERVLEEILAAPLQTF